MSFLGSLIAKEAFKKAAIAPVRSAQNIAAMIRLATKRNNAPRVAATDPFDNIDGDELAARLNRQWRRFVAWWFVMFGLVALGLWMLPDYLQRFGILGAVPAFLPVLPVAAQLMTAAFGHWQLRARQTGNFWRWMRTPGAWWPSNSSQTLLGLGIALLLAGVQGSAYAAGLPLTQSSSNLANQIIDALIPVDGTATPLTVTIEVLAGAAAAAAAAGLAWSTLATTARTAAEGKLLGEKVSAWSVIRICIGFALIVPTSSGLPVFAGVVVRQVALAGSSMADKTWVAFAASNMIPGASNTPGIPPSVGGEKLAEQVLRSSLCSAVLTDIAAHVGGTMSGFGFPAQGGSYIAASGNTSAKQRWSWGYNCGSIAIDMPDAAKADAVTMAYAVARVVAVGALVQGVQNTAIARLIEGAAVPQDSGDSTVLPVNILDQLAPVASAYDKTMITASSALIAAENPGASLKLGLTALNGGWTTAGEYTRAFAQLRSQAVHRAVQSTEWTAPVGSGQTTKEFQEDDDPFIKIARTAYGALDSELALERDARGTATADDLARIGDNQGSNTLTRLLAPIDNKLSAAMINLSTTDAVDPVGDMVETGALLLDAGEAGIAAGTGLAVLSGNPGGSLFGAGKAFDWVAPFARSTIYGCLVVGWVMEYLVPILPWIAMLWLVVGWVMAIIEAMIFGALWSVLLCKFEGAELVDQVHRPGLVILFNLLFIPPLGIAGFAGSFVAIPLVTTIVGKQFAAAYVGAQGGQAIGIMGVLGGLALMGFLQYHTIVRVLTLVHTVPHKLPSWIGMPAPGFGEAEAQQRTNQGIIVGTQGAGRQIKEAGGRGGDRPNPSKVPGVGGGESAGIQPADKGAAGGGEPHWTKATGGAAGLSEGQEAQARAAFKEWAADKPEAAAKHGFDGYVNYAQEQEAARAEGGA